MIFHQKSHPKEYKAFLEKFEEERMKRNSNSTKKRKISSVEESGSNKKKILEEFFVKKKLPSNEQDVISGRILDYIIANARPLSTVDSPHFLKLVGSLNPRFQMFTRNTLAAMVVKEFYQYKDELMSMLCKVSKVCLTADAWSSQRRAYLGITIHWLDEVTLTRYSRALALKQFFGDSRISGFISSIIQEYQLEGKVQHIVTDNGLSFVKAGYVVLEFDSDDLYDILKTRMLDSAQTYHVWLPDHIRCASHTLNLLAKADVESVLKTCSPVFQSKYEHSMKKIPDLWNKCGRSIKAAEMSGQIIGIHFLLFFVYYSVLLTLSFQINSSGRQLPSPCATRWNSFFDCLRKLQVSPIEPDERNLLREYLTIMTPIAIYLDVLQGETNCYLGPRLDHRDKLTTAVLPHELKLPHYRVSSQISVRPLVCRVGYCFDLDDYVLASVSNPAFKFAWLKGGAEKCRARQKLSARIAMHSFPRSNSHKDSASANELFNFKENDSPTKDEVDLYLCDEDKAIRMLDRHPAIKNVFLRYNAPLPSSAPVERLFSDASLVLTARRFRLSDKLLEYLLLLKIHKKL
ncbi:hypothetical protein GHT06_009006 [Daphnia sinensis]|uniref:AC9 transposase n=1 Tax=Daphnia sinensis TaxID=1820382 RepID=A0AAD5L4R2_9CRUS|nr:hypothetical protein GHT06_009006 [Daphnia sinensis]